MGNEIAKRLCDMLGLETKAPSGTVELDRILGGGFPLRSLVLLSGNPGCGKTIMATRFLYDGATERGEKGVYVSFAENREDYYNNMMQFDMNMKTLEGKGLFKFLDYPAMSKTGMREATTEILNVVVKFKAKRLVVDSITAVLQVLGEEESRTFLHMVFGKVVKSQGITTIVIGEIPYGDSTTGFGMEEFVADSVIILRQVRTEGSEKRIMDIAKMRGVQVQRSVFEYVIDRRYGGIGIVVLPTKAAIGASSTEKLTTGIKVLDEMVGGGFYRGSVTLIAGASGIGKTTLCLQLLVANAKNGEKTLYLSFEEPVTQIMRTLKNYGLDHEKLSDKLIVESYVPEALTPLHYYTLIRDHIETYQPTVVVFDTLTAVQRTLSEEDFTAFVRYLQLLCKEKSLTAIITTASRTMAEATGSGISTLADNIILMRYNDVEKMMMREMVILKTRGSAHETKVKPFEIAERGIVFSAS
jgi:circadian clock protein KaiC